MKVKLTTQLANHLGVFKAGSIYEDTEAKCLALIAHGYAYDPKEPGPVDPPWDGDEEVETMEAEPEREKAATRTEKPKRKYRRKKK